MLPLPFSGLFEILPSLNAALDDTRLIPAVACIALSGVRTSDCYTCRDPVQARVVQASPNVCLSGGLYHKVLIPPTCQHANVVLVPVWQTADMLCYQNAPNSLTVPSIVQVTSRSATCLQRIPSNAPVTSSNS